jgi:septum formation protein
VTEIPAPTDALVPGLILASSSPRRHALLAQLGIVPDRIIAPDIDETPKRDELPRDYVRRIARDKSARAAELVDGPCAVLVADTVVAVGRRLLAKAETRDEAARMLALLSGRRHTVLTCIILAGPGDRRAERVADTAVAFSRLTPAQHAAYLDSGEWQGKAGGYAIQGRAAGFVRFLSGSYSNVVGLPLFETAQLLRGAGLIA